MCDQLKRRGGLFFVNRGLIGHGGKGRESREKRDVGQEEGKTQGHMRGQMTEELMLLEVEVTTPLCFYRLINSCSACHVLFPSIRLCCGVAIAPLSSHFSYSGLSQVWSPHRKLLPPPQTKHKDSWLTQQREMTPLPKTECQRNSNGYYGGNETREASCTRKYFGSPFAS